MMVKSAAPNANDKKFPSIMADVCLVDFQNSFESKMIRLSCHNRELMIELVEPLPGVLLDEFCLSSTNLFIAFNRSRNTSTDSFFKSSEKFN